MAGWLGTTWLEIKFQPVLEIFRLACPSVVPPSVKATNGVTGTGE